MAKNRTYIAIDLKSFYASVECRERGLDPLTTNLVVADKSRTEKTICLAVSPSLKTYGVPGRPRLFEVVQKVKEANARRRQKAPHYKFDGASYNDLELKANPALELDYIVAPPRMAYYMEYSTRIYNVYLKYVAPEDIHVYSIDEVFMDVTAYLNTYQMTARELTRKIIQDVLDITGITATAGIGTNLYLCKIAMDIVAKHTDPDRDGVRIAELDEMSYRKLLWTHRPLTDFWRVGKGYAKKLEASGLYTMGDVARCSIGKPNEYYAVKNQGKENNCKCVVINAIEQIGRYSSMALMCVPLLVWEFGFQSVADMILYFMCDTVLLVAYLIIWRFYFIRPTLKIALSLAILPTLIFLISGVLLRHWLLVAAAVLFGIGHIYITVQNHK